MQQSRQPVMCRTRGTGGARRRVFAGSLLVLLFLLICPRLTAGAGEVLRILSMEDPFARAWHRHRDAVAHRLGLATQIRLLDYESTYRTIAVNAARQVSAYDLVAVDVVWVGHYTALGAFLPLDEPLADRVLDQEGFIDIAWRSGQFNGHQVAVPIQPHPEILLYRKSVLRQLSETPPQTTDDALRIAGRIHTEFPDMDGICWNGRRGAALGQQMLHFAGAFGARVVGQDGLFSVRDAGWIRAFEYAAELVKVSPGQISDMAWDGRIAGFSNGSCAMSYAWGARTATLEAPGSPVAGDVGYAPAPVGSGIAPNTPLGLWLLAIPSNIAPSRVDFAVDALLALTSRAGARLLLDLNVSALPRWIDGAEQRFPVLALTHRLDALGQLTTEMRPPVPSFQALSEIIGVEAHRALFDGSGAKDTLRRIESRIRELRVKAP